MAFVIPEAHWTLVAPHRARLVRLARQKLRGAEASTDAEDVVHEAMLRVASLDYLDPPTVSDLLDIAVVRRCITADTRGERRARLLQRTRNDERLCPQPDEVVVDRDFDTWVLRELARHMPRLSPLEREVLLLRAAGRSLPETAALVGVNYKATDNAYRRARKRLRELASATTPSVLTLWLQRLRDRATATAPSTAAVAALGVVSVVGASLLGSVPRPAGDEVLRPRVVMQPASAPAAARLAPARSRSKPARASGPPATGSRAQRRLGPPPVRAARDVYVGVVEFGPVRKGDTEVILDDDEGPVELLQRCAEHGVNVVIGPHGGVTCRERPSDTR